MAYPTMSGLKFLFHPARHTAPPSPFSWNANARRLLITNATAIRSLPKFRKARHLALFVRETGDSITHSLSTPPPNH